MATSDVIVRSRQRPLLHLALLVATVATTFVTFLFALGDTGNGHSVRDALEFSLALVLILGTHEMGHYFLARAHGVDTTLPYFIPVPFIGPGTLGAVIRIRGRIPNRNALIDIGAAGPLAGLVVALPLLAYGIATSDVVPKESFRALDLSMWHILEKIGQYLHARITNEAWKEPSLGSEAIPRFGGNLLTGALTWLTHGDLGPALRLSESPVYKAAWFGMVVTMLNLIPVGQLDGGHVAYALLGHRARWLGWAMAAGMLGLVLFSNTGWFLWLIITSKVVGFGHPPVIDPVAPVSAARKWTSLACAVALILCIIPVPVRLLVSP